jgi:PTS system nitrogen regulatory IIA component
MKCRSQATELPQSPSPAVESPVSTLGALLCPECILLDLDVSTKKGVFEKVGQLIEEKFGFKQTQVVKSLCAREQLGSTGLGNRVAFPHARIKGLPQAVAAFVRTHLPIPFDAPDEKPVSEILVLLVPEKATQQHLQLLASAARMFADRRFREQLRMCGDTNTVSRLFTDWPRS